MIKPEEVMKTMDEISYGWLDIYDRKHINTIDKLTELYRVSSPEEVLKIKQVSALTKQSQKENYLNQSMKQNHMQYLQV